MWCSLAGFVVVPECPAHRCTLRPVGPKVLPVYHRVLHLPSHPLHEDQHLVSDSILIT